MDVETPLPVQIERVASKEPGRVFVEEVAGPTHTYEQFHLAARRWADAYASAGVQQGDYVATMLPTGITSYQSWVGLGWLRAIEVPINDQFVGQTLVYPLHNCQARILVISQRYLERLQYVADSLEAVKLVVVPDATEPLPRLPWQVMTGEEFLAGGRPAAYEVPKYHDAHAVIYTSGTTGPSKGVLQPWANIHAMAHGIFPLDEPGGHPNGAVFTCWPVFHSSGKFGMTIASQFGLRMVLREKFSVSSFWSDVRSHGVTHAPLLVIAGLLLEAPEQPDDADSPLVNVGMYPLIPDYREFERRFGVRVSAGYGTTEAGWVTSTADAINHRVNGRPRPGVIVKVVDEAGEEVPVDQPGEIVVRHEMPWRLNKGYLGKPEASAEAWRDGWFHTGDAGKFDADGNLYFVDRLKDYLRHRGHNISSFEVEAEVLSHPDVLECACVGVPSDLALPGQKIPDDDIKIFVVVREGSELTEPALWEYLEPRMPRFMLPRYIEFTVELPRTATGKVRKADLRGEASERHGWQRPDPRRRGQRTG